jgi:hypothetical protein
MHLNRPWSAQIHFLAYHSANAHTALVSTTTSWKCQNTFALSEMHRPNGCSCMRKSATSHFQRHSQTTDTMHLDERSLKLSTGGELQNRNYKTLSETAAFATPPLHGCHHMCTPADRLEPGRLGRVMKLWCALIMENSKKHEMSRPGNTTTHFGRRFA